MKNIIQNLRNAKLALLFFAISGFALSSCSDTSLPTSATTDASLLEKKGDGREDKNEDKKGEKRDALPLPCLELSAEQLEQLALLKTDYSTAQKAIQDEFKAKLEEIKNGQRATLSELEAQLKAIKEQKKQLERANRDTSRSDNSSVKIQIHAIRDSFKLESDMVRKDAKDGLITREEASAQLRLLKQQMEEAIKLVKDANKGTDTGSGLKDSAEWQALVAQEKAIMEQIKAIQDANKAASTEIETAMKAAKDAAKADFYAKIREMLNDDQKAIWDAWITTGKGC